MHITEAQAVYLEKFLNFRGNIAELAAAMDIPLVDMIDILSAPAVQKRIKAAAKLTKLRRKMIVADIEITALETLEQVAANKYADIVERRRAAAAILRALHKPKRRRSRATNLIHSRGQSPQTDPPDDPLPPSQNRARQEAAAGQTNHSTHTPNPTDEDLPSTNPQLSPVACGLRPSPPDQTARNAAIYCPQEFLDELHEARKNSPESHITSSQVELLPEQPPKVELLSEQCSQVEPLSERCSPEVARPSDNVRPTGKPLTERLDKPLTERCHQGTDSPGQNRACQEASSPPTPPSQNRAHQQAASGQSNKNNHTASPINKDHPSPPDPPSVPSPTPSPKDNPWETHPFARAFRSFSSQSNHDPP